MSRIMFEFKMLAPHGSEREGKGAGLADGRGVRGGNGYARFLLLSSRDPV